MSSEPPDYVTGTIAFDEKYPRISGISISITETKSGLRKEYCQAGYSDLKNVPCIHPCHNSRCKEGGLDLNRIIGDMVAKDQSNHKINLRSCIGYTTVPRGNSPGTRCTNDFSAIVKITYRE